MSDRVRLIPGDCLRAMRLMAALGIQVDSIVCDPPYHLTSIVKRFGADGSAPAKDRDGLYKRASGGFMGKKWDGGDIAFDPETWKLAMAVLKPGGHLVAFGGTRGWHRMAVAIEDAGFEIRDSILDLVAADAPVRAFLDSLTEAQGDAFLRCIEDSQFGGMLAWLYGSGFPKSHNQVKAIDGHLGCEGETVPAGAPARRMRPGADQNGSGGWEKLTDRTYQPGEYIPATPEAAAWDGWGTGLKPAFEPIVLARKPLGEKSVAANVLRHGTGAVNVGACQVGARDPRILNRNASIGFGGSDPQGAVVDGGGGRWPANVCHDGGGEVEAAFAAFGESKSARSDTPQPIKTSKGHKGGGFGNPDARKPQGHETHSQYVRGGVNDSGTASRFFYSAKAGPEDRFGSKHPTVKPVSLIRWLQRLVTPPGGLTLDPFAGSGTAGVAAIAEGFRAILIEADPEYQADIRERLAWATGQGRHALAAKARNLPVEKTGHDDLPLFAPAKPEART